MGICESESPCDHEDPDPERRYKISTHVYFRHQSRLGTLAPFASRDGLTWKLLVDAKPRRGEMAKKDLVLPAVHFEPCGGLYKWDGVFYASGQNALGAVQPYHGRVARMYHSADFTRWSHTSSLGLVREAQYHLLGPGRSREGEQTHEGISVWNRRNVLLGIFGQWHGGMEWQDVTIDLGLAVSNDGVHFREPVREWTFLKRGEDGQWDQGGLLQGQGFENINDKTYVYYGAWDPRHWQDQPKRGGVGIAMLARDRLGALTVDETGKGPGDYQLPTITSEFVTAPVDLRTFDSPRFYINVDGLDEQAWLSIELLDDKTRPLASYSGVDSAQVRTNGFQVPLQWPESERAEKLPDRVRFRVRFDGPRNTQAKFYALYAR